MAFKRLRGWLRALSAPRRAVPVLLTGALIAALVEVSGISDVFQRWRALSPQLLGLTLALAMVYFALKSWQFRRLLKAAGLSTDWRGVLVAFAVGEMTLLLPLGIYAQNYVLSKSRGQDFARSAATTTAVYVLEIIVLTSVLAALPVYGWPLLRKGLWIGIGVGIVLSLLLTEFHPLRRIALRLARRKGTLGKLAHKVLAFLQEMRMLGKAHALLHNVLISAAYLFALVVAFQQVGEAVGKDHIGLLQAVTIYAFGLLVAMTLGGLISQLGTVELAGAAIASSMGLNVHNVFTMLIWFRLLWTASIWIIAGGTLLTLRRELLTPSKSRSASRSEDASRN